MKNTSGEALSYIHEDSKTTYVVQNYFLYIYQHKYNLALNASAKIQKLVHWPLAVLSSWSGTRIVSI